MEVVNKNVESKKNDLGYFKNIEVHSSNKHEEIELDNYIASVVMIITNSSTLDSKEDEYIVYLIFQDKKDSKVYGKFYSESFKNDIEADKYYIELKNKAKMMTTDEILNLLEI